jgi:hypothetical protein
MVFILDEWLIHDLQNDNGKDKQKESFLFLEKIKERCDKISFIAGSKFNNKFWLFCKRASDNIELKGKVRFLKDVFNFNSLKTERINLHEVEVENSISILENINQDDHYLVKGYIYLKQKGEEALIITTDKKLMEQLKMKDIPVESRDDFLKRYAS